MGVFAETKIFAIPLKQEAHFLDKPLSPLFRSPPGRLLFLTALGQTHLWLSSAKRNPTPGAPAQELALTKLMISPGAPGLPNRVRKFGVGYVGWV